MAVTVVVPRPCASAVPAKVGEVRGDYGVRWQKGFVDNSVGYAVLPEKFPSFLVPPCSVTELYGEAGVPGQESEETLQ